MEKLIRIAKIFVQSIQFIFVKSENREIKYNANTHSLINVTIINPTNTKVLQYDTLIDNIFIPKNRRIGLPIKYKLLMDLLLDCLYSTDSDPTIRDCFCEVFNIDEIKLMLEYFKGFPNFNKTIRELSETS